MLEGYVSTKLENTAAYTGPAITGLNQ